MMNFLVVLTFSAVLATVLCLPGGPPDSACGALTPTGHTGENTGTGTPYQVTITPAMYGPGAQITVTVSKTDAASPDFKGIMVQARLKSGGTTPLGTFSNPSTGTTSMMCTSADSTWSHSDNTDKMMAYATWTAPMDANEDMVFRATVVQINSGDPKVSAYYEGLTADLTYDADATAAPMPTIKSTTKADAGKTGGTGDMNTMKSTTKADAGYLRASLICTGLALFAIALVGRRL